MDAKAVLGQMTPKEKTRLLSGSGFWHTLGCERLGVPSLLVTDGPHGLRKQLRRGDRLGIGPSLPATCFPTSGATACSFDPALLERIGRALGEECRKEGVALLLGPGVNIQRNPLCGRDFEYFSEDPLLAGTLAAAFIRGVQSAGVGACLKHFAANSQELYRNWADSVVDQRALREIYLRPFEIAVKAARPWAMMTAYNRLNGTFCSQNPVLMRDLARGEWGFDGLFVTDWGAMSDPVESFRAGLDLEMPGVCRGTDRELRYAVETGALAQEDIDRAARNVLALAEKHQAGDAVPYTCDMATHAALARQAARESAVLLKNDGLLPLRPGARLAVIGGLAKEPRYQGAGSSRIEPVGLDSFCQALDEAGAAYGWAEGFRGDEPDDGLIAQAVATARDKDAAVVFAGLPEDGESEGFDRAHMELPEAQNALIQALAEAGVPTAVVLQCGSPVALPWAEAVNAVLLVHLAGQEGGHAAWELLSGAYSPEGRLAQTWPAAPEDVPSAATFSTGEERVQYRESIFVGYRYYCSAPVAPAYPFGHGLAYTTFDYSDLAIDGRTVRCTVKNTGAVPGAETVQLYVSLPGSKVFRAERELKGFQKLRLAPGQEAQAVFTLPNEALAWYDPRGRGWSVEPGQYRVLIGASCRDIRLEGTLAVTEGVEPEPLDYPVGTADQARFEALLGHPVPPDTPARPYTKDTLMIHARSSLAGKLFLTIGARVARGRTGSAERDARIGRQTVEGIPLRGIGMAGGDRRLIHAAVELFNGHPLRAVARLFRRP